MTLYTIDDLHFSVNDIHEQWDDGKMHYEEAEEMLVRCCEAFIESASKKSTQQPSPGNKIAHTMFFKTASDCYLWLEENEIYNPVTLTVHLED
jgi:hypothetical protein